MYNVQLYEDMHANLSSNVKNLLTTLCYHYVS